MTSSHHPRLPNAVAQLYAGLTVGLQFMVDKRVISRNKAKALTNEGWASFMAASAEQSRRVEQERPALRFLAAFQALRNSGRLHFDSLQETEPRAPAPNQVNVGWIDEDGNYLLNPAASYAEVRRFCNNTDEPMTFKEDAVWRDLKELGLTECLTDRTRYRARVYGVLQWVIKLRKSALDDEKEG